MVFSPLLRRWALTPDGPALHTPSSDLLPVRAAAGGPPLMLKLARGPEEERGHRLMVWLAGDGAARVLRHDGPALLMERLDGPRSLSSLVQQGQDDAATRVLVGAAAGVHRSRPGPWPALLPLADWFRDLEAQAAAGGLYALAWTTAQALLADPQDVRPLHGDLHHGNVLDAGPRGWLVIDPKGLIGERGFDFANLLCNPDLSVARQPGRLARQAQLTAQAAGLDPQRLLRWTVAYAGLSAAWHQQDGQPEEARQTLDLGQIAAGQIAADGLPPA